MWSKCGCWNVLEVKNKIKEGGIEIGVDIGHLRGGEKQEKEKRKKRNETCMDENEMKEK